MEVWYFPKLNWVVEIQCVTWIFEFSTGTQVSYRVEIKYGESPNHSYAKFFKNRNGFLRYCRKHGNVRLG